MGRYRESHVQDLDLFKDHSLPLDRGEWGFLGGTSGKEFACQCRRHRAVGLIAGLGRPPGGEYGNPLQYSCLENFMDRGAWQAIVYRVIESQTGLKRQHARTDLHNWIPSYHGMVISMCFSFFTLFKASIYGSSLVSIPWIVWCMLEVKKKITSQFISLSFSIYNCRSIDQEDAYLDLMWITRSQAFLILW